MRRPCSWSFLMGKRLLIGSRGLPIQCEYVHLQWHRGVWDRHSTATHLCRLPVPSSSYEQRPARPSGKYGARGQVPVASPATLRQRISRLPAGYPRRAIVPQPRAHLISQARIFPTRTQKPDCRELMTRAQTTGPGRLPAHGQCASSLAGARAASQSSDLWSASEDEWSW